MDLLATDDVDLLKFWTFFTYIFQSKFIEKMRIVLKKLNEFQVGIILMMVFANMCECVWCSGTFHGSHRTLHPPC